ncbi:sulfhydryl oxidase 1-like isoform X2, partial [Dinothrombium tinctorium]
MAKKDLFLAVFAFSAFFSPFLAFHVNQQLTIESLFTANDVNVVELSKRDFERSVHQSEYASVVLFYLSWCGHCINFAPVYKKFALEVVAWRPVLRVAAINCADTENNAICNEYGVLSYPKIKFFEPRAAKYYGTELKLASQHSVDAIVDSTLKILDEYSSLNSSPPQWPHLSAITARSKRELLSKLPFAGNTPLVTIVEKLGSLLGLRVILDLSEFHNRVIISRVVGDRFGLVHQLIPDPGYLPVLLKVKATPEIDLLARDSVGNELETRWNFIQKIDDDFLNGEWKEKHLGVKKVTVETWRASSPESYFDDSEKAELIPVHYVDLYNGIRISLHEEIGSHPKLNQTQVKVVRNYFRALLNYFPFENENARRFVKRMTEWFNNRKSKDVMQQDFLAIMKAGSEGFLPRFQPWQSCKSSKPNLRGYPCSLWLLFHTLTVSEYKRDHIGKGTKNKQKLHTVLYAIRDYIKYFFRCEQCAKHFIEMSANLENELPHSNSSVLWLWEAHNKVNARLKGDLTEDPLYPKVQFPTSNICAECHVANNVWDKEKSTSSKTVNSSAPVQIP